LDGGRLRLRLPDPFDDWIPLVYVDEIVVYLPERGIWPTLNTWPPAVR
jgi:hypothetical protein